MAAFCRGQGELVGPPPTAINVLEINYSRVHWPPCAAELICFRTLAMAYLPLQLTESLSRQTTLF